MRTLPEQVIDAIKAALNERGYGLQFGGEHTDDQLPIASTHESGLPAMMAIEMGPHIASYAMMRHPKEQAVRVTFVTEPHMHRFRSDLPEVLFCRYSVGAPWVTAGSPPVS